MERGGNGSVKSGTATEKGGSACMLESANYTRHSSPLSPPSLSALSNALLDAAAALLV